MASSLLKSWLSCVSSQLFCSLSGKYFCIHLLVCRFSLSWSLYTISSEPFKSYGDKNLPVHHRRFRWRSVVKSCVLEVTWMVAVNPCQKQQIGPAASSPLAPLVSSPLSASFNARIVETHLARQRWRVWYVSGTEELVSSLSWANESSCHGALRKVRQTSKLTRSERCSMQLVPHGFGDLNHLRSLILRFCIISHLVRIRNKLRDIFLV